MVWPSCGRGGGAVLCRWRSTTFWKRSFVTVFFHSTALPRVPMRRSPPNGARPGARLASSIARSQPWDAPIRQWSPPATFGSMTVAGSKWWILGSAPLARLSVLAEGMDLGSDWASQGYRRWPSGQMRFDGDGFDGVRRMGRVQGGSEIGGSRRPNRRAIGRLWAAAGSEGTGGAEHPLLSPKGSSPAATESRGRAVPDAAWDGGLASLRFVNW